MKILVDMDGVIADFERGVLDEFKRRHPDKPFIPLEKRTTFYVKDQYPIELRPLIEDIQNAPGLYRSLKPISGGLESLREMSEEGHDVFICTSPLTNYKNCVLEKYEWVDEHLGIGWVRRMILTKDKTLVKGEFLIDDRPDVIGAAVPEWEHILFGRIYNQMHNPKSTYSWKMDSWADWREFIKAKE